MICRRSTVLVGLCIPVCVFLLKVLLNWCSSCQKNHPYLSHTGLNAGVLLVDLCTSHFGWTADPDANTSRFSCRECLTPVLCPGQLRWYHLELNLGSGHCDGWNRLFLPLWLLPGRCLSFCFLPASSITSFLHIYIKNKNEKSGDSCGTCARTVVDLNVIFFQTSLWQEDGVPFSTEQDTIQITCCGRINLHRLEILWL